MIFDNEAENINVSGMEIDDPVEQECLEQHIKKCRELSRLSSQKKDVTELRSNFEILLNRLSKLHLDHDELSIRYNIDDKKLSKKDIVNKWNELNKEIQMIQRDFNSVYRDWTISIADQLD